MPSGHLARVGNEAANCLDDKIFTAVTVWRTRFTPKCSPKPSSTPTPFFSEERPPPRRLCCCLAAPANRCCRRQPGGYMSANHGRSVTAKWALPANHGRQVIVERSMSANHGRSVTAERVYACEPWAAGNSRAVYACEPWAVGNSRVGFAGELMSLVTAEQVHSNGPKGSVTAGGREYCKSAGFLPLTDAFGSHSCKSTGIFDHFRLTRRLEVKITVLSQKFERSGRQ